MDVAVAPRRRRRGRPPSATDRLAGGIERARAVNTRRETVARSRHKGCRSHIAPASVPGELLPAGRQRGRAASAPNPSTLGRSPSRRVELTRVVSDLFNDGARPYRPQLELDRDENGLQTKPDESYIL